MLDEKYYQAKPSPWTRLMEWIGLSDRRAALVVIGVLAFLILVWGVLPRWLRAREAADLRGVAARTAPGVVDSVQFSALSHGGGGLFNAVTVTFAGHHAFYNLPDSSRWKPKYGENVTVIYRIGRQSGLVHLDKVTPVQ